MLLQLLIWMFQMGSSKVTEDGSQIQLKTAMSMINSTRVFSCSFAHWNLIYSIFLRVSLDSVCIFLSFILLFHVSWTRSYYSTVLCKKFIIVYLLVCVFIITEFMSMNKLFSVRSLENNVNYVQNSIFSLQSSGQVFVSLLPFILYYFTMQCIIRNFKITLPTCCKLEIMYGAAL